MKSTHPLQHRLFRQLCWATLISNMGTWMHEMTSGWLMTQMAPTAMMVSLVQSASTLPYFLLALPAGALADLVDRRRYLLLTQGWMMLAAALTAALTLGHVLTPWGLLACTYLLALGGAMNSPAWHAITPEIVEPEQLPKAVVCNGLAIDSARALGPALGGLVLVWLGPGPAFALNALSYSAVLWVLFCWRRPPRPIAPAEPFLSTIRVGLQYVRHNPYFRTTILRSGLFVAITNSMWGLLPLICQRQYGLSSRGYGLAMGLFGLGAVIGGLWVLPRLRQRFSSNAIVTSAWIAFVPVLLALGVGRQLWLAMLWGGLCWMCILSCFHLAAQSLAPAWVRARAMSVYLLVYFGAASAGSLFWGTLADQLGLGPSLLLSAGLLLGSAFSTRLAPLRTGEDFALQTGSHWPDPVTADHVPLGHGPILVTVEYQVDLHDAVEFREAMERIRRIRYRNGVLRWGLFVDLENPCLFREVYLEESWAAHLRQHARLTDYDAAVSERAYWFHRGPSSPKVIHFGHCDSAFPSDYGQNSSQEGSQRRAPQWFLED